MLVVETVVRIRREYTGGKPIKEIGRDLRLSRKGIRKAIRSPEGAFDYHRSVQPMPWIEPFRERLDTLLAESEARPRLDRLRMTRTHDLLLRAGFEGSYDAVRRYAARWAEARSKDPGAGVAALVPLLFRQADRRFVRVLAAALSDGLHAVRAPFAKRSTPVLGTHGGAGMCAKKSRNLGKVREPTIFYLQLSSERIR